MIKVAAASLNQTPLDWSRNIGNINSAISMAYKENVGLLVLPELAITGYGCEDAFLMEGVSNDSLNALSEIFIPQGMLVAIGLPLVVNNRLYNAVALCKGGDKDQEHTQIMGFVLKQNLAMNGIHYEARWFSAWEPGIVTTIEIGNSMSPIPVGDLVFEVNGIRIGFEICEDAWVASRPGRSLFDRGVDIIVNPSASHFAIGKQQVREQFVQEGSRAFGAAYIYCNMNGCESGRVVFDGGNLIASGGKIVAKGARLNFGMVDLVSAVIDLQENRTVQMCSSQRQNALKIHENIIKLSTNIYSEINNQAATRFSQSSVASTQQWQFGQELENEETSRAIALGLRDWNEKTCTNGYVLSLSGGADSGLVASLLYMMVHYEQAEQKSPVPDNHIKTRMNELLDCVYQGSKNSGSVTLNAAKVLMQEIGGNFYDWKIDDLIDGYVERVNGTGGNKLNWHDNDIALQNIQARVRSPGVWLLANRDNKLLLTTGNLSESSVGYMTMDGDTSGVLAPISGVSKVRVLRLLKWLCNKGSEVTADNYVSISNLSAINNQQPTAELRPDAQTDEDDLMPFPVLDSIRRQALLQRRRPKGILINLLDEFKQFEQEDLVIWIKRFYSLFSRNQWKRERMAVGFHIESESLDPKTFSRFPVLNSGLKKELEEL
jgi:NAD+ synthetase